MPTTEIKTVGRTYEKWNLLGYHVIKGSKSTKRNKHGVCLFTPDQVEKNKTRYNNHAYYDSDCSDGDAYDFGFWEY